MYENIPDSIKNDVKWVCSRANRKMPLRADMLLMASSLPNGYVNYEEVCASVSNPATWCTFEQAMDCIENKVCSHIGYVFDGNGIIGVDLDHCFERGVLTDKALSVIRKFHSYTEISKSGEGIHILVRGKLPFQGSNNQNGVEVYSTARFFILTGRTVGYTDIIENQEAIDWLLSEHFQTIKKVGEGVTKPYKPSLFQTQIRLVDTKLSITVPKIKEGSRNCTLLSYAGVLRSKGMSDAKIIKKVHEMNAKNCVPPLSSEEVDNIIKSIMKYSKEV